jgi:phenylalanyl-tRNA synthetase beta chain
MKVSLQWLREWVNTGDDVPALSHALTMAGIEIEGVEQAAPALMGIVVGEVLAVENHPDAEKLRVCRVASGSEELQIVCGAPNVRLGLKAPLALIGAKLPNGMEIKKAKLRGVESAGMLCSAKELGLNDDTAGLFELSADFVTGQNLVEALSLDDTILAVNLTPNRGDCMSIAGVAREVAAVTDHPLSAPPINPIKPAIDAVFPVRLAAGDACPKFVGRVIRGVNGTARSPFWLQERLRRAGLRPLSAVIDVTNYVMLELGQPMHAYDLGKLSGAIVVRFANAGEQLTLLDGRTVDLTDDVLVIADERKALGLAGVMGGSDSSISNTTVDIFLEVAFFSPDAIAGRGRRYGLVTDASQRFERGVDPRLQERAIERATQLLLECAGGKSGPVTVTRSAPADASYETILLRHRRIEHVLGATIDAGLIETLLRRLGMQINRVAAASGTRHDVEWQVVAPSWRFDIHIEEDLIEEVARLYGFDNIPEQHARVDQATAPWTESRLRNERAADLLVDRGYHEAITYSFTDAVAQAVLFEDTALALKNPISAELGVMRLSLWPGLLQAVRDNQRRQQQRVRLFEIGRRFAGVTGAEEEVIAGVASGPLLAEQWAEETREVDFFDVKADVEALLALTGEPHQIRFVAENHPALHPGQTARIYRGDRAIGWLGSIHPQRQRALDLTYGTVVFEIETRAGFESSIPRFHEISKYPAIRRDIALIVDEAVAVQELRNAVQTCAGELLKAVGVVSVYRGKQFDKGKKSIALGLHLQDTSRTLTDPEADAIVARVVDHLARQFNATIRDK